MCMQIDTHNLFSVPKNGTQCNGYYIKFSRSSGALTNGCRQVGAEGLAAIGGVGASIAFV